MVYDQPLISFMCECEVDRRSLRKTQRVALASIAITNICYDSLDSKINSKLV